MAQQLQSTPRQMKISDLLRITRKPNSTSPELSQPSKRGRALSPTSMETEEKPGEGECENDMNFMNFDLEPAAMQYIDMRISDMITTAVQPHLDMIKELHAVIVEKDSRIKELESQLAEMSVRAAEATPATNCKHDSECARRADTAEYRLRLKQLRITNIDPADGDDTDAIVCDLGKAMGVDITPRDLDTSHFLDKPGGTKKRSIIASFNNLKDKVRYISARKKLRESQKYKTVYVNESLSKDRYALLRKLVDKKNEGLIHSAWSFSGCIYFRKRDGERGTKVKNPTSFDFDSLL